MTATPAQIEEMNAEEFLAEVDGVELDDPDDLLDAAIECEGVRADHGCMESRWVFTADPCDGEIEIRWKQQEAPDLDYLAFREVYKRLTCESRDHYTGEISYIIIIEASLLSLTVTRHEAHRWRRHEVYWECEAKYAWRYDDSHL